MQDLTKTELFGENTKTTVLEPTKTELLPQNNPPKDRVVPVRHIRLACLALAVIGIPILYLTALYVKPQPVKVEAVSGTMQSALVQITGTLIRDPRIIQRPQGIARIDLFLDDGTGTIQVSAFKSVARDLVINNQVPRLGDVVEVSGTIKANSFGDFGLVLTKAGSLSIRQQELPHKSLAQIKKESFLGAVQATVKVLAVQPPGNNNSRPWRFTVSDDTANLDLIVWSSMLEPALPLAWGAGATLKGRFAVSSFRGNSQLSVSSLKDLTLQNPGEEIHPVAGN